MLRVPQELAERIGHGLHSWVNLAFSAWNVEPHNPDTCLELAASASLLSHWCEVVSSGPIEEEERIDPEVCVANANEELMSLSQDELEALRAIVEDPSTLPVTRDAVVRMLEIRDLAIRFLRPVLPR
jgi:hypothetical protein